MYTGAFVVVDRSFEKNLPESAKEFWKKAIEESDVVRAKDVIHIEPSIYNRLVEEFLGSVEKDPYGIKNVNFSLIKPDDSRWKKYQKQRL